MPSADKTPKLEQDRRLLLSYVLKQSAGAGRLKLPPDVQLPSVDLDRVDVKYTLDQIENGKDVIIPLAWVLAPPSSATSAPSTTINSRSSARSTPLTSPVSAEYSLASGNGSGVGGSNSNLLSIGGKSKSKSDLSSSQADSRLKSSFDNLLKGSVRKRSTIEQTANGGSSPGAPALPPRRPGLAGLAGLAELTTDTGQWKDPESMQISSVISVTSTANVSPLPPTLQLFHIPGQPETPGIAVQEEPEGYMYKTYCAEVHQELNERLKHNWRWQFRLPIASDDGSPTENQMLSLYELLLLYNIVSGQEHHNSELQDYLSQDIRPSLGVSTKKDKLYRQLLSKCSGTVSRLYYHTFRFEMLKAATVDDFADAQERMHWQNRQLYMLFNGLLDSMPIEESVRLHGESISLKTLWLDVAAHVRGFVKGEVMLDAVLASFERVCDLLSQLPESTEPNYFMHTVYQTIMPTCMDPDVPWQLHHSQSNFNIIGFMKGFRKFCELHASSHEICLVAYLHRQYLQSGRPDFLSMANGYIQPLIQAHIKAVGSAAQFPFHSVLLDTYLTLKHTLCNYYDWPLPRTSDFQLICTLYLALLPLYESLSTTTAYPVPLPLNGRAAVAHAQHLGQLLSTAKQNQYRATLQETLSHISEERLRNYVSIWTGQSKIDFDVFWPIAQTVLDGQTWWDAVCRTAVKQMVDDLVRVVKKEHFSLGQILGVFKELAALQKQLADYAEYVCPQSDSKVDLALSAIISPLVHVWATEQSVRLPTLAARTVEMDNFQPVADNVLYSSSVVDLFSFVNTFLQLLFTLPVPETIERWIVHTAADVNRSVAVYAHQCTATLPPVNTHMSWSGKDKQGDAGAGSGTNDDDDGAGVGVSSNSNFTGTVGRSKSRHISRVNSTSMFTSSTATAQSSGEADVQKLYVRLNNLVFAEEKLQAVNEYIVSQCKKLGLLRPVGNRGQRRFVWQNLFRSGTRAVSNARTTLVHHIAARLVYTDTRAAFFDSLYLPSVYLAPLHKAMTHLDVRGDIMRSVHEALNYDLLYEYMSTVVEAYRRVLFEVGNRRFYRAEDYEQVEADIDMLKELFLPGKDEDPSSGITEQDVEYVFAGLQNTAQAVMPLGTQHLIELYEQSVNSADAHCVDNTYPLSLDNLKCAICHRLDPASKQFVKRHRIKGVKMKESKTEL
ncbi:hypothetical protein RI367_000414 [Sorochytrium milnesiophthora]